MTKKERDEAISTLASRIYNKMLDDIMMDVVLKAHQEVARSRTICTICHTRCGQVHLPGASNGQPIASSSSHRSPVSLEADTGTNTPVNGKSEGTAYFECENCKRQIASNRYAPHLSSCLGLGNSRRGAIRNANTKTKLTSEAGRSASPYMGSDHGNVSDDGKGSKSKSKSRAKRQDEAEFSLNRKRTGSPSLSPAKKPKKAKLSGSAQMNSEPGTPNHLLPISQTNSQKSKIPSRLRENSIPSSIHKDDRSSSPESRDSSPARSVSTQGSTLSFQSPIVPPNVNVLTKAKPKNGKPKGTGPPQRRPSPPRPPPPPPPVKKPEPDYLVDVEGDETGSSTDTDSS